jgi:hypothetical protein
MSIKDAPRDQFARLVADVVKDKELREALQEQPVEALAHRGITLSDNEKSALGSSTLAALAPAPGLEPASMVANVSTAVSIVATIATPGVARPPVEANTDEKKQDE